MLYEWNTNNQMSPPASATRHQTPLYTEGIGRVLAGDLFGFFVLFLSLASYKCNQAVDEVCIHAIIDIDSVYIQAINRAMS